MNNEKTRESFFYEDSKIAISKKGCTSPLRIIGGSCPFLINYFLSIQATFL